MNDTTILQPQPARCNNEKIPCVLVIFARAPLPGQAKTRLIGTRVGNKVIDASGAARLYDAMLRDTIDLAQSVANCEVILAHTPDDALAPSEYSLRHMWRGQCSPQGAGDLAARLTRCFKRWRNRGFEKIVVIGSDAPDLPGAYLRAAFDALDHHDLVLGPAHDGGFYLIGAAQPIRAVLFRGVRWSTSRVLEQVLANATRQKKSTALLDRWRDVDNVDDLHVLIERLRNDDLTATATRGVLASMCAL